MGLYQEGVQGFPPHAVLRVNRVVFLREEGLHTAGQDMLPDERGQTGNPGVGQVFTIPHATFDQGRAAPLVDAHGRCHQRSDIVPFTGLVAAHPDSVVLRHLPQQESRYTLTDRMHRGA